MSNINIDVNIQVPDSEFCNGCCHMTPIINLYSEPECLIFNVGKKLKYIIFDKYEKWDECKKLSMEDEEIWKESLKHRN